MPVVAGTRLRIRALRFLPAFFWRTYFSVRQLVRADGFVGGVLLGDKGWVFWTVTVWEDEARMKAYRNAGDHAAAMAKVIDWCDEVASAHWSQDSGELPEWGAIARRIAGEGRFVKLPHASSRHTAREVPAPARTSGNALRPRR
jgi:hypothetical protein